jgi:hypothetical protein
MRLVVPFPPEWPVESRDDRVRAVVPGHTGDPDVIVVVSPVRPLPAVAGGDFIAAEVGIEIPAGGSLRPEGSREDRSERGWPVTIVRAAVIGADGEIEEQRIAAVYRLLDQFATVVVIGKSAERWNQLARSLGDVVLAADLDWSGPPACLAEVFGIDADHPVFAAGADGSPGE